MQLFSHKKSLRRLLCLLVLLLCASLLFGACGNKETQDPNKVTSDLPVVRPQTPTEELPQAEPIYHPLTGRELTEKAQGRMLVVSVDNSPDARPQSGVSTADIVYELPAEGGIPRMLLCFYGTDCDTIGPVRSARPYFVEVARSWDAFFAHCGWSPEAQLLLRSNVVDYVNELDEGETFWRDDWRPAPHNLYTSTALLEDSISMQGYAAMQTVEAPFLFLQEGRLSKGAPADQIWVEYPLAANYYEYDKESKCYTRWLDGAPYIDAATGEQVCTENILIQWVTSYVIDDVGRLSIDMCEGGDILLFTGGRVVEGSWSKASSDSPTEYRDNNGEKLLLNRGQTWIQVCDGDVYLEYADSSAAE